MNAAWWMYSHKFLLYLLHAQVQTIQEQSQQSYRNAQADAIVHLESIPQLLVQQAFTAQPDQPCLYHVQLEATAQEEEHHQMVFVMQDSYAYLREMTPYHNPYA